jgi:hypothetical protein
MEDGDEVELRSETIGDFARAVRRVVVDHEHIDVVRRECVQHQLEVLSLVVGREADGRVAHEQGG